MTRTTRMARRSHLKRVEREGRDRDMNQDPTTYTTNELAATIFRLQHRLNTREARLYGRVDLDVRDRLNELLAEQRTRREASSADGRSV